MGGLQGSPIGEEILKASESKGLGIEFCGQQLSSLRKHLIEEIDTRVARRFVAPRVSRRDCRGRDVPQTNVDESVAMATTHVSRLRLASSQEAGLGIFGFERRRRSLPVGGGAVADGSCAPWQGPHYSSFVVSR